MTAIDLVMPMADLGSGFSDAGFAKPKPLLRLDGRPFFWWAAESVRCRFDVRRMVFVILREHVERHHMDDAILDRYPAAELVVLPDATSSSVTAAVAGCAALSSGRWLMVNDCDHAFDATRAAATLPAIARAADGFLCHVVDHEPAAHAGYGGLEARRGPGLRSTHGIAYGFRDRDTFIAHATATLAGNPEAASMSQVYTALADAGGIVRRLPIDDYVPFGTPDEYDNAASAIAALRPCLLGTVPA